ncbi:adenylate cyclase [Prauserella marina]|uniref:Adenylate cyclase n=1 Tax=Prauserella marina TaxID=530584 RepID=A0A222VV76_9PSEU|nr:adenylate/guanylate cyclase domain-containing protein [Prauserella marina]ASR37633.1 adenylate cyclase [Prauserella marina]PWV75550.1 adenylate cyclase [Prauserella marina]SDD32089.1 adenylate cyclase [Prauserella marina]
MAEEPLPQRLERILLGGKRKYTRLQVAERAGVPEERSKQLWMALGFASVPDDQVVFTEADVEAMRVTDRLVASGLLDKRQETAVARTVGLHLSRLAEWQADLLGSLLEENPELAADDRQVGKLVAGLLPELEQVQNFVWRRHLAAYAPRAVASADEGQAGAEAEVVGFVDMVGYTRLTRRADESELSEVLDRFEAMATEVIAELRGRVVKMIGDEVLFVADAPVAAAEIALTLAERADADEALPSVRAGLAAGRVLSRFGDVYGSVVNLASRLTAVARPGTILVDRELAKRLAGAPGYELRTRRAVTVRGYNRLRPSALRRAEPFDSGQELAADLLGLTGQVEQRPPSRQRRR